MRLSFLILTILSFSFAHSQENNDLVFFIPSQQFFGSGGNYVVRFSTLSNDKRFSHDNFIFRIIDNSGNDRSLYQLGTRIDISTINSVIPHEFYKDNESCKIHEELSLTNTGKSIKSIYIVTKIPPDILIREKDKTLKHMIWKVKYDGTNKDISYVQLGKGPFLTRK
jgi:hypothetical protein